MATVDLTDDRRRLQAGTLGAAARRIRQQPAQTLAWGRLRRAFRRQAPLVGIAFIAITAAGCLFDYLSGGATLRSLLFWAPIGAGVALLIGAVREFGRNTITSLASFGSHRGYAILGAAPELTPQALRQLPPDRRTPLDCVVFQPSSPFATAFRDLQEGAADERVVSFVAALPGEGASTAALCTAASAALQGKRVILVDCDLRLRSLTKTLVHDAQEGVLEASQRPGSWRGMLAEEEETGLHFLPAAKPESAWRTLTGAPGFAQLVRDLQEAYDLVVLDCPSALSSADGAILASAAQRCVLVAAWDRTPLPAVRAAMRALRGHAGAATAVYVNRVPPGYRFGRLRPE
ncbi:MAG: AAA family ATPase [Hyphomonadaceae bacterium]|nr:AAA family ATPase [Hyphomonadaceae bacterium]